MKKTEREQNIFETQSSMSLKKSKKCLSENISKNIAKQFKFYNANPFCIPFLKYFESLFMIAFVTIFSSSVEKFLVSFKCYSFSASFAFCSPRPDILKSI